MKDKGVGVVAAPNEVLDAYLKGELAELPEEVACHLPMGGVGLRGLKARVPHDTWSQIVALCELFIIPGVVLHGEVGGHHVHLHFFRREREKAFRPIETTIDGRYLAPVDAIALFGLFLRVRNAQKALSFIDEKVAADEAHYREVCDQATRREADRTTTQEQAEAIRPLAHLLGR